MNSFAITLHPTYYAQGFFNVKVASDSHIPKEEGKIYILLGDSKKQIEATVNRHANRNNTARILGGVELRDWFQQHFSVGDSVTVTTYPKRILHLTAV
jgi:hypothetical protein